MKTKNKKTLLLSKRDFDKLEAELRKPRKANTKLKKAFKDHARKNKKLSPNQVYEKVLWLAVALEELIETQDLTDFYDLTEANWRLGSYLAHFVKQS